MHRWTTGQGSIYPIREITSSFLNNRKLYFCNWYFFGGILFFLKLLKFHANLIIAGKNSFAESCNDFLRTLKNREVYSIQYFLCAPLFKWLSDFHKIAYAARSMHANETSTYFRDLVSRFDQMLHWVARNKFARLPVIGIHYERRKVFCVCIFARNF